MSQTIQALKFKKEREGMIQWLSDPINETDIYFDVVSKYYEDLMEILNEGGKGNIRITCEPDHFKIKFLHLLYKHSRTR